MDHLGTNFSLNISLFIRAIEFENVELTHWGRATHICVSNLTFIGSDNGLSPDRRQAIIWTNAGLLLIGPLGTNFSEILIEILTFSFKKMGLKVSSAKRRPFCLGLNVLSRPWHESMKVCPSLHTQTEWYFSSLYIFMSFTYGWHIMWSIFYHGSLSGCPMYLITSWTNSTIICAIYTYTLTRICAPNTVCASHSILLKF